MATDNSILQNFPDNFPVLQKQINAEIADKIAAKEIIANEISERERLLSENLLRIDDLNATKITMNGFVVKPKNDKNISYNESDITSYLSNDIPEGSIVNFGEDKKIRIFASNGVELSLSDGTGTDESDLKYSISVPSGSIIQDFGKNTHIIYQNKIVMTIVDNRSNKKMNSKSTKYGEISPAIKDLSFPPETEGQSWVAWAQYKPSTEIKSFSADWMLPDCPLVENQIIPPTVPNNIIFNGIEPSNGSIILQPVTAFNYNYFKNDIGSDWENNWYGSAFIESDLHEYDFHSTPIRLNSGDWVNGFVYYIADADEWVILLTTDGQTTQKQYSYLYYHIDPTDVDLVTTYEAWFNDTRYSDHYPIPSDLAKCGNIKFENLKAWDKNLQEIPITWIAYSTPDTLVHPGLTNILVDNTTQAPSRVTIFTNYTPPNVLAPVAAFSSPSPTTGTAPIAVPIFDSSTNNPTSWSWNFGDGQTSTQKNPVHMFTSPGTYTVSLTATNSAGSNTKTRTSYVSTEIPPSNQHVVNGECNSLTGWTTDGSSGSGGQWYPAQPISSGGADGGGYLEMEAFGDPNQVNTHGSAESLMYQDVNLTNVNTLTYWLKSSVFHSTGNGGSTSHFDVYLDNTRIYATTSAIFSWQQFSYPVSSYPGVHRIKFDSYTSNGGKIWADVDSVSAMAQINSPVASFTASSTSGTTPFQVSFSDASTNTPTAWAWDFGDNSTSIGKNSSHTYTASGTYTVKLMVANTAGNNTITRTNYITSNPKIYTITSSAGPGGLISPSGAVNVPEGDSKTFIIQPNFGYVTETVLVDGSNVTIQGISYTFPDVHSAHTINASFKPLPLASFTSTPHAGTAPLTVRFTDTTIGNPTGWQWDFGDNSSTNSTKQHPVHTYSANGTYSVILWVTGVGGTNTTTRVNSICVGECRDKIGIYRDGAWYLDNNGNGIYGAGDRNFAFGGAGWTPVIGDWASDGKSKGGVYKDGNWYLDYNGNGIWDAGDRNYGLGGVNWTAVTGDWNGAGSDKIGAYKDGAWYLDYDGSGTWTASDKNFAFGGAGWTPVVGKWTSDGKSKVGVYNDGVYYIDYSGDWAFGAGDKTVIYGTTGSTAVIGDWNANGLTEVGTQTGSNWQLDYDGLGALNASTKSYTFGAAGWNPVIGDWNGDGKDKIGIYQDGAWYLDYNGNGVWEGGTDKNYAFGSPGWIPVIGFW